MWIAVVRNGRRFMDRAAYPMPGQLAYNRKSFPRHFLLNSFSDFIHTRTGTHLCKSGVKRILRTIYQTLLFSLYRRYGNCFASIRHVSI